jgi:hypothetical protein
MGKIEDNSSLSLSYFGDNMLQLYLPDGNNESKFRKKVDSLVTQAIESEDSNNLDEIPRVADTSDSHPQQRYLNSGIKIEKVRYFNFLWWI